MILELNGRDMDDTEQLARRIDRGNNIWRFKLDRAGRIIRFAVGG